MFVALQDPPVSRGKLPSFQLYSSFSPPNTRPKKPRVAFPVFSSFLSTITLLQPVFARGDVMALDLFTCEGFFTSAMPSVTIINPFSTKGWSNNTRSVLPDHIFHVLPSPTLTLGNLNIRHSTPDPLTSVTEHEIATAVPFCDRATER